MVRTLALYTSLPDGRASLPRPCRRCPTIPALEEEVLELVGARGHLREAARAEPRRARASRFFDGPVTANKTLGVHTAWGRTLKDVFQRYKALRGFDQRYQNGFDCQGLWIEVGVERELGLNSKREIEEYGLEEFARKCRDVVVRSSRGADPGLEAARPVDGLGQRLLHVQRHEHRVRLADAEDVHERGWLYLGHRSTEWCPRCGTSISQHELRSPASTRTAPTRRSSSASRCSTGRGESLVVWTTTPWTLPANVAAAVNPDAEYGRRANGEWVAVARYPDETFEERLRGSELVGWRYAGPVRHAPARRRRRASRHPVGRGLARRGHRHRPHRAGLRRRGLRARQRRTTCRS